MAYANRRSTTHICIILRWILNTSCILYLRSSHLILAGREGSGKLWGGGILGGPKRRSGSFFRPWWRGVDFFFITHWQTFVIKCNKKAVFVKNNWIWVFKIWARGVEVIIFYQMCGEHYLYMKKGNIQILMLINDCMWSDKSFACMYPW